MSRNPDPDTDTGGFPCRRQTGRAEGTVCARSQWIRSSRVRRLFDDAGVSMVVTALSMVCTAALALIAIDAMFHGGGTTTAGTSSNPQVSLAEDVQAQQALSTALDATGTAAAGQGGYGSLSAASLAAAEPSVQFVSGPSTGPGTVSVVSTGPATSQGSPGAVAQGLAAAGGEIPGQGGGAVTLADRSADGVCWYLWRGGGSAPWYGARTGQTSCQATAGGVQPTPSTVSSTSIGWQSGSFPSA